MSPEDSSTLELARAQARILELEGIVQSEARSLDRTRAELRETEGFLGQVLSSMDSAVLVVEADGHIVRANTAAQRLLGVDSEGAASEVDLLGRIAVAGIDGRASLEGLVGEQREVLVRGMDACPRHVLCSVSHMEAERVEHPMFVLVGTDISQRRQAEVELRHSQKLESVGQLAAGIAHEINTPVQFIGDSLTFLGEAFTDFERLMEPSRALVDRARAVDCAPALCAALDSIADEIDLDFLREEVPAAVERAIDGVRRVARIVGAMKEFAHPGSEELVFIDLNRAIHTTLTVAKGEFKYIAEIETDLAELPPVRCYEGDINQVILNVVVNAAHAIKDRLATSLEPGRLRIATRQDGDSVLIEIADNGGGIPAHLRERIFDPFFTTKGVGRGTGQGLALTHKVIVERHNGEIRVDSEVGRGTCFTFRIPIDPMPEAGDGESRVA